MNHETILRALFIANPTGELGPSDESQYRDGYNTALEDSIAALDKESDKQERAAWSAITGEAAAYIEDAANCLRDPDAKRAAKGAAEFVRKRRREILGDKQGAFDGDSEETRKAFRDYDEREPVSRRSAWQIWRDAIAWHSAAAQSAESDKQEAEHTDDKAMDRFAQALKEKMAAARAKGRGGWEQCSPDDLSRMLREHVEKGDPRDVANFCMMLWSNGAGISKESEKQEAVMSREDWKELYNIAYDHDSFELFMATARFNIAESVTSDKQEAVAEITKRGENWLDKWFVEAINALPDGTHQLYAQPIASADVFDKALKQTYEMVDPFNPPAPGTYRRGEHEGIIAALKTVRANYDAAIAANRASDEGGSK